MPGRKKVLKDAIIAPQGHAHEKIDQNVTFIQNLVSASISLHVPAAGPTMTIAYIFFLFFAEVVVKKIKRHPSLTAYKITVPNVEIINEGSFLYEDKRFPW
jgi:hypothetical protein